MAFHLYKYLIRWDHVDEDLEMEAGMLSRIKSEKDFKGSVVRKYKAPHIDNQKNGEVWLAHGTPEETAILTDYEKTE